MYHGLLPETVLNHIKFRLLCVEGLFRQLEGKVHRTPAGLVDAIDAVFASARGERQLCDKLLDNCIFNKGDELLRARSSKGEGKDKGSADGASSEVDLEAELENDR